MKKALILLGPTGVGKTAAALLLAQHLGTEIISSDSMQIYRHMDIGTAKPTREERALIRHHMIDIVDPWERFSTGAFIEKAGLIVEHLLNENRLPFIVGGTGLYLKAMTRGIFKGPSQDAALRAHLQADEQNEPGVLFSRLQALDPASARRIMPNDLRRIIRAIEVCLSGKASMSAMQEQHTEKLPYDFIKVGLTRNRDELYSMIDRRVGIMIEQGLVGEVRNVLEMIGAETRKRERKSRQGDARSSLLSGLSAVHASALPALQAIGYKELLDYFDGGCSLDRAAALIKQRSRNYAKRQFTWFRQESDIRWIDISGMQNPEDIFRKVLLSLQDNLGYESNA